MAGNTLSKEDQEIYDTIDWFLKAHGIEKKYADSYYEKFNAEILNRGTYERGKGKFQLNIDHNSVTEKLLCVSLLFSEKPEVNGEVSDEASELINEVMEDFYRISDHLNDLGIATVMGRNDEIEQFSLTIMAKYLSKEKLALIENATKEIITEKVPVEALILLNTSARNHDPDFELKLEELIVDAVGNNKDKKFTGKIISSVRQMLAETLSETKEPHAIDLAMDSNTILTKIAKRYKALPWVESIKEKKVGGGPSRGGEDSTKSPPRTPPEETD